MTPSVLCPRPWLPQLRVLMTRQSRKAIDERRAVIKKEVVKVSCKKGTQVKTVPLACRLVSIGYGPAMGTSNSS